MKKIWDKFEGKYVRISDNDFEAIKTDAYSVFRYDINKVKSQKLKTKEKKQ